jgi:predicted metal-binding protein
MNLARLAPSHLWGARRIAVQLAANQIKGHKQPMAKRRGNPNWGKPEPIGPVVPTVTSFEQVVKEFKLTPDQYIRSTRLREWARRNKNSKYIPEALLEAWGFEIESTL